MHKALLFFALGAFLPFGLAAEEQAHGADHDSAEPTEACSPGTGTVMTMPPPSDAVVAAWRRINMEMHPAMSIAFTGDPDTDFMKGMIPHHQGAIDMANVLLEHGVDADTRALANAIIVAQEECRRGSLRAKVDDAHSPTVGHSAFRKLPWQCQAEWLAPAAILN